MQSDGAFPGVQSAFEPAGQGAEQIDALAFVLTAVGAAVFLVLPDWQGRRLNKVVANTLSCSRL